MAELSTQHNIVSYLTLFIAMRSHYEQKIYDWILLKRPVPENKVLKKCAFVIAKVMQKRLLHNQKVVTTTLVKYHKATKEKPKDIQQPRFRGDGRDSLSEMVE